MQRLFNSNFDTGLTGVAGFTILWQLSPILTLHLARFNASSFFKPTLLLPLSTCIFHVFLGRPHFLFPFTSNSNTFLKTCPSSLLNICPYHLTPFAFVIWTTVSFNPKISIRSPVLFFYIRFSPHTKTKNSEKLQMGIEPMTFHSLVRCYTTEPRELIWWAGSLNWVMTHELYCAVSVEIKNVLRILGKERADYTTLGLLPTS